MRIVKSDIIERAALDTVAGHCVRSFYVDDIPIQEENAAEGRTDPGVPLKAIGASGMPQVGERHPEEALKDYAVIGHRFGAARDTDACYIDCIYQRPPSPGPGPGKEATWTIRFGSTVSQDSTQIDAGGHPILVSYNAIGTDPATGDSTLTPYLNTITANVLRPKRTISAWAIFPEEPDNKYFDAVGAINSKDWRRGKRGTWICLGFDAETRTEGQSFLVEASFLHDPEGHYAFGWHLDETAKIPTDITPGDWEKVREGYPSPDVQVVENGLVKAAVHPEIDFFDTFGF